MMDDLRPKGTVTVHCSHSSCGMAWWVDPLDPRLNERDFRWDCGEDHNASATLYRRLSLIQLRTGYHMGSMSARGPEVERKADCQTCGTRSYSAGVALFHDRERAEQGILTWSSLDDLKDPETAVKSIEWDPSKWVDVPGPPADDNVIPPDHVQYVGYLDGGHTVRRYTFVPCVRSGCKHRVMVDYDNPNYKPDSHAVGSWGGGALPLPVWWGRTFRCEDGMSTFGPQPCSVIHGDAVAQFEQASGARWTMWWHRRAVRTEGSVLFYDAKSKVYGLFTYNDLNAFTTPARIAQGIQWGSIAELERTLSPRRPDVCDEILLELGKHVRLAS